MTIHLVGYTVSKHLLGFAYFYKVFLVKNIFLVRNTHSFVVIKPVSLIIASIRFLLLGNTHKTLQPPTEPICLTQQLSCNQHISLKMLQQTLTIFTIWCHLKYWILILKISASKDSPLLVGSRE